jgi:hypothetical protein
MWGAAVPVVYPVGSQLVMANSWESPIAGAFVMQGGYDLPYDPLQVMYDLPFDQFQTSPTSGPEMLQHQADCQKFFQKFQLPEAAGKTSEAFTKKIEAEASKCIDTLDSFDPVVSEAISDHGCADSDRFALDGDSMDSFARQTTQDSFDSGYHPFVMCRMQTEPQWSCPQLLEGSDQDHADDVGIRHADDAVILDQGAEQDISVSIKNTFFDLSPKSMKKRQTGRSSRSLPPSFHTTHGVN